MLIEILAAWPAMAVLTATVRPGYILGPGEAPSTDKLNALGQPTVDISGSIDGSTGLSAGSVTGNLLADGVPDGISIGWNGGSPRQLYVLAPGLYDGSGGITSSNNYLRLSFDPNYFVLATNSWANTNSNTGSPFVNWLSLQSNSIDDTIIKSNAAINSSKIYLPSGMLVYGDTNNQAQPLFYDARVLNITQTYTNVVITTNNVGGTNIVTTVTTIGPALTEIGYSSTVYTINGGQSITNTSYTGLPHGAGIVTSNYVHVATGITTVPNPFNAIPSSERWAFLLVTNNNGYVQGDMLDASSISGINIGASRTNAWITIGSGTLNFLNKNSGASVTFNPLQWTAICFLRP